MVNMRSDKTSLSSFLGVVGLLICIFITMTPATAYADSGAPIVTRSLFGLFICLIPIILIESFYLGRKWGRSFQQIIKAVFIANLISTILGFLVSAVILNVLKSKIDDIVLQARVTPFHKVLAVLLSWGEAGGYWPAGQEKIWTVGIAIVICFLPSFILSWLSECPLFFLSMKGLSHRQIRRDILVANLWSYLFLIAYAIYYVVTYRFVPNG